MNYKILLENGNKFTIEDYNCYNHHDTCDVCEYDKIPCNGLQYSPSYIEKIIEEEK